MAIFVLLTKLSPEAIKDPSSIGKLGREIGERIRRECPEIKWLGNYAVTGPYDYLDLFEAKDEKAAAKVALIIRSYGHATTETWMATPWEKFLEVVKEVSEPVAAKR